MFPDEATPALDEDTERVPYAVAQGRLPGITVISVAHRPGVEAVHRRQFTLHPETRSIEGGLVRATAG